MNPAKRLEIFTRFRNANPHPTTELEYTTPFELLIAVLLRFMDSFMIYTEPFVLTGGGPGNATTFLSQYLTQKAVGQFDLGPAAAFSLIYFLIILLLCFILYNWMQRVGTQKAEVEQ